MYDKGNITEEGKRLAYLLRHDKEYRFDKHGWRDVSDLVSNHGYTMELLDEIVETNNKKRYEYSTDKKKIRARQGHSVNVDVELKEQVPPDVLFHGTSETASKFITKEGIVNGMRLHVHLSVNEETAISVGKRHGKPAVLMVDSKRMSEDGVKFFLSNNGVWLTEFVDKKYILCMR